MTYFPARYPKPTADPLDDETIGELIEEGWDDQLILIDGVMYDTEDLYLCAGCDAYSPDALDDDEFLEPLCEDCLVNAREEAEGQRDLESWARWACR